MTEPDDDATTAADVARCPRCGYGRETAAHARCQDLERRRLDRQGER